MDVMQYTGMRLEIDNLYLYDLDKDYDQAWIIHPGDSVHWKIRMEAPQEKLMMITNILQPMLWLRADPVKLPADNERKMRKEFSVLFHSIFTFLNNF
jgi:hypothetical protein